MILVGLDPVIGDRHTVGVPHKVRDQLLPSAEWAFGVNAPLAIFDDCEQVLNRDRGRQASELALLGGCPNAFAQKRAKAVPQSLPRKVAGLKRNPPASILGEPSAGHHAMGVEMKCQALSPSLQVRLTAKLHVQLTPAHLNHALSARADHCIVDS